MSPAALRMTVEEVTSLPREEWAARVIAQIEASAQRCCDHAAGLLIDYGELPDAVWRGMATHFGVELTGEQVERMREAARFDAKSPGAVFSRT